jgi:hypothetical protein
MGGGASSPSLKCDSYDLYAKQSADTAANSEVGPFDIPNDGWEGEGSEGGRDSPSLGTLLGWDRDARYFGEFETGGSRTGALFRFPDGSTYEGEWLQGLLHGKGKLAHSNGDIYEGCFITAL